MTFRKNVTAPRVDSRRLIARATAIFQPAEDLERRTMFCALHDGQSVDALLPTAAAIQAALAKHTPKGLVTDHTASWYKAARKVTIRSPLASSQTGDVPVRGTNVVVSDPVTFTTNAAGLPLLTSRADGQGLKIFLDFDGYGTEIPFDMSVDQGGDGNGATFNAVEQSVIYGTWRDIVSFYSALNVNVTTVQPPTGGANPDFVWQRITDSVSGGAAYVGAINNSSSQGWTDDSNAIGRHSGIAHEIAHQLSLSHQADWNNDSTKQNEYSSGYAAHGPIIGVDFAQQVHKWFFGRNSDGADHLQDDLAQMTAYMQNNHRVNVGDGYRPDDFIGTTPGGATAITPTNGSFQSSGIIERTSDADWFSFTSTGSAFDVNAEPTYESPIALKLEVYDSTGKLIAGRDDTGQRGWTDNTGEEVNLDLAAGTYYARVSGHGDYGDIGEYAFYASPMPAGFTSRDVTQTGTGRGGYTTYDASSGTWNVGGSGADISGTADNFRFAYQTLTGNGSITARVTGLDNTNTFAKAGVMLRETLTSASRHAFNYFTPTASETAVRSGTGASTAHAQYSMPTPNWIRLTRVGDVITFYGSTNGTTFTQIGGTVTLSSLANQVYIGLAVTSHDTKKLATAGFTNVTITGNVGTTQTFNALSAPTNLTAVAASTQSTAVNLAWTDGTGETGYGVERSVDGLTWSPIGTTAANVATYADSLSFGSMRWWYRVSALDATGKSAYSNVVSVLNKPAAPTLPQAVVMNANYLSLTWRDTNAETGYRLERSTNGGSYTTLTTLPANITGYNNTGLVSGTTYSYRITPLSSAGDGVPLVFNASTGTAGVTTITAPVRIAGNTIVNWVDIAGETGYRIERSTDRTTWGAVGTVGANATTITDTTTAPLTRYYYRIIPTTGTGDGLVGAILPVATRNSVASATPWISADVGVTGGAGASYISSSGAATVLGSGDTAATATADGYQFLYRTLTGDGEIIAHITGLDAVNLNTKAGVMIRDSLAADAKTASVMYQAGNFGTDFFYRGTAGAAGVAVDGPGATTYSYLRLVRLGTNVTAYASTTNGNWTQIGTAVNIGLGATTYVGLAASSRDTTFLTQATFDGVAVNAITPPSLTSLVINDGSAQRSMVKRVFLNFSEPVALAGGAVSLQQKQPDGSYAAVTTGYTLIPVSTGAYSQSYRLQFVGNSVADGRYRVVVTGVGATGALGNSLAADVAYDFTRLYGDVDGDGGVSINDFNGFASAFGTTSSDAAYNAAFDNDGDNGISINDFNQFASRFGVTI